MPFRELSLQLRAKKRKKQNKNEAYLSRRHAITKLLKWRRQIRSDVAACFLQDRQSLENAGSFRNFTLILNFTTETNWNNLFEKKKRKKKYYAPESFVTSYGRFKKYRVNERKENEQ